jgi:hypothetical protein
MKRISRNFLMVTAALAALVFLQTGCDKDDNPPPPASYPIQGLWSGTFTTVSGFVEPPGTDFYFALSIYPDGKMSCKSGTNMNAFFVYAEGSWSLTGNNFSWTAKTINSPAPAQTNVSGTATFDAANGKLTNGVVSTTNPATEATWKMDRIN